MVEQPELVKRIAEHHHGHVVAESRKDRGSRFTISPFTSARETTVEKQSSAAQIQPAQPFPADRELARTRNRAGDPAYVEELNRAAEAAFDAVKPTLLY